MNAPKTTDLRKLVPELEDRKEKYLHTRKNVLKYMRDIGVTLPPQPMMGNEPLVPEIPKNPKTGSPSLNMLSLSDLSDLYVQFTAYHGYLTGQLALARIMKDATSGYYNHLVRELRFLQVGPQGEKKEKALRDQRALDAEDMVRAEEAKVLVLTSLVETVKKNLDNISREVTMRGHENEHSKRENNIGRSGRIVGRRVK